MFERRVARTYWYLALWLLAKFGFGAWTLGEVKKARFSPRTVVDVGAGLAGFEPATHGPGNRCSIP
jgi:hypothetical protein